MAGRYGFDLPDANVPAGKSAVVLEAQDAIWYQTNILKLAKKGAKEEVARDLDDGGVGPKRWCWTKENGTEQGSQSGLLSKFMKNGKDCPVDSVGTRDKAAHINITFHASRWQAQQAAAQARLAVAQAPLAVVQAPLAAAQALLAVVPAAQPAPPLVGPHQSAPPTLQSAPPGGASAEPAAEEDIKPDLDEMVGTAVQWAAGKTGHEKADFQKVSNKFAIAIVPSFNMGMSGQRKPSSGFWFRSIEASDQMQCQYAIIGKSGAVDELCREEIIDRHQQDSESQLKYLIENRLPGAMRFGGNTLPTSLWIIAHGTPGHVKIGEQSIPVLKFVSLIKEWTERSAYLQHVHIEACSALYGVTPDDKKRIKSIKDVVITGYDAKVGTYGVDIAQGFGTKFMHALSTTVAAQQELGAWEELDSERLWGRVKLELQGQVGQAHRGEDVGSSEAETFKALKVI